VQPRQQGQQVEPVQLQAVVTALLDTRSHQAPSGEFLAACRHRDSGFIELFAQIPEHLRPEAVDTTRGTATIFPALSFALIRLYQGDRAGAEEAYALAGPIRSGTPLPAMRCLVLGFS
jgi:hypothetical protein